MGLCRAANWVLRTVPSTYVCGPTTAFLSRNRGCSESTVLSAAVAAKCGSFARVYRAWRECSHMHHSTRAVLSIIAMSAPRAVHDAMHAESGSADLVLCAVQRRQQICFPVRATSCDCKCKVQTCTIQHLIQSPHEHRCKQTRVPATTSVWLCNVCECSAVQSRDCGTHVSSMRCQHAASE